MDSKTELKRYRPFLETSQEFGNKVAKLIEHDSGDWVKHSDALAAIEASKASADEMLDVLHRNGFRRCDISACNCGSWHLVGGWRQRFEEIKDALSDAGHPLTNENGNLVLGALGALIAERDALAIEAARPKWLDISTAPKDEHFLFQTELGAILTGCILDMDHPDCQYDGGVHESWSHDYVESAAYWQPLPQKASKP